MNVSPVRELGRQAGIGFVLAVFVALVTFMFSFLGTILCAAMFGMMVGFVKKWKWQFILISFLFPALLLASFSVSKSKSELLPHECYGLAAVGFGTFWVTYLATRGLFLLEGRTARPVAERISGQSRTVPTDELARPDLDIEDLHGAWLEDIQQRSGDRPRRMIRIHDQELTMSHVGEDGQSRTVARVRLQLAKLD